MPTCLEQKPATPNWGAVHHSQNIHVPNATKSPKKHIASKIKGSYWDDFYLHTSLLFVEHFVRLALNYSVFNGRFLFFFLTVTSHYLTWKCSGSGEAKAFWFICQVRLVTDGRTLFLMRSFYTTGLQQGSPPSPSLQWAQGHCGRTCSGEYQGKAQALGGL